MKCKECGSCMKGWFKSKPKSYVCIGVKEPFVIEDINVECTEYEEKRREYKNIEDSLHIGVDFSLTEENILVVTRNKGDKFYVINMFKGDEAIDLYNKLIGE